MQKPQYITIGVACIVLVLLLAFGSTKAPKSGIATPAIAMGGEDHAHVSFSIDSVIANEKAKLREEQVLRLNTLENSISRGDVKKQQIDVYHQLAHFWRDSGQAFLPFAWYTAQEAILENSEKNLNFAAQLFLDQLQQVEDEPLKHWMAEQSKDLFERSLKINPTNDSAKVGLGAVYLYGGLASPMEGIGKIREVIDRDSTNIYAQMTLAYASVMSGQTEKAVDRLHTVIRIDPQNVQALIMLGDVNERLGNKQEAVNWYSKAIEYIPRDDIKDELKKRIESLKK